MESGDHMPEIAEWIKKIIALLVLVGFLEMILPNNELKGVTKMVMGLLVILIFVQPVLKIFKFPVAILNTIPVITKTTASSTPTTGRIIKAGLTIRDDWTAALKRRNQELLIEKIKTSMGLIDGIKLLEVKVKFKNSGITGLSESPDRGDLEKIKLRVRFINSGGSARVSLAVTKTNQQYLSRRIRDTIKLFSNLTDDQIEVIWDG